MLIRRPSEEGMTLTRATILPGSYQWPFNCRAMSAVILVAASLSAAWLSGCAQRVSTKSVASSNSPKASGIPAEPMELFVPRPIGDSFKAPPRISFVKIHDLDQDGLVDVLVCDCNKNAICWIRQVESGKFEEQVIADQIVAPARLECVDLDGDGDQDLLIAVLGQLFPTNERVGSVVILENNGDGGFTRHLLLDQVARVSDVRAGDLDQDGDLDLVVTQFGYNDGEIQWLENQGSWRFASHPIQNLAGGIHGIVADMNQDAHLDIVAIISQEIESIFLFCGNGHGDFRTKKIYSSKNPDFGSSGISLCDLDADGDLDILYCNGDAFDYSPPRPWPWHGFQWLENLGQEQFRYHRLLDLGGATNSHAADFDGDGDLDIFVTSTFNDWDTPESQSLILLENAGNMTFKIHGLANAPTHLQALDVGDLDNDGRLDLVTGGMHVSPPYDRVERVVWWRGNEQVPVAKLTLLE